MLNDKQMLEIANKYISFLTKKTNKELLIYKKDIIKKEYGNIYSFESKKFIETGDFDYKLLGNGPFLVEKETGKVIKFGTAYDDDDYIKAYEKGTLEPSSDRYWYHEDERYDYK